MNSRLLISHPWPLSTGLSSARSVAGFSKDITPADFSAVLILSFPLRYITRYINIRGRAVFFCLCPSLSHLLCIPDSFPRLLSSQIVWHSRIVVHCFVAALWLSDERGFNVVAARCMNTRGGPAPVHVLYIPAVRHVSFLYAAAAKKDFHTCALLFVAPPVSLLSPLSTHRQYA